MASDAKDGDRFDFEKEEASKIEEKMTETRRAKARDRSESHKEKSGNDCVGKTNRAMKQRDTDLKERKLRKEENEEIEKDSLGTLLDTGPRHQWHGTTKQTRDEQKRATRPQEG